MNRRDLFKSGSTALVAVAGVAAAKQQASAIEIEGFEECMQSPGIDYLQTSNLDDCNTVFVNGEWYSFAYDDATAYAVLRDGEWQYL